MDKQKSLAELASLLDMIDLWADEDIAADTIMSADEFLSAVEEDDSSNPIVTLWHYYQYLTGAGDEW